MRPVSPDAALSAGLALSGLLHAAVLASWPSAPGREPGWIPVPGLSAQFRPAPADAPAPAPAPMDRAPRPLPEHAPGSQAGDAADRAGVAGGAPLWIDTGRYYEVSELTRGPRPLRSIAPYYADAAPDAGRVVAGIQVNERGTVDAVAILASTPEGAFDDVVRAALRETPFFPGMVAGVPVKSRTVLDLRFESGRTTTHPLTEARR